MYKVHLVRFSFVIMMDYIAFLTFVIGFFAFEGFAELTPGDIVCRFDSTTKAEVNYYTCKELANKFSITVEKFFELNPTIDKECSNVKPKTKYCVAGYEWCKDVPCMHVADSITTQIFKPLSLQMVFAGRNTTMQRVLG